MSFPVNRVLFPQMSYAVGSSRQGAKFKVVVAKRGRGGKRPRGAASKFARYSGPMPSRGGATYARRMSSMEKKNIDIVPTIPAVGTTTSVITCLNPCQAGGLPTNRVGRRITMTSLLFRGRFQTAPTTTGNCPIRIIIFYDKQTNKAAPVAGDVLAADSIEQVALLANSHRFRVLRDIVIPCVGTAGPQSAYVNEYIKMNKQVEYIDGAGAGTVADITSGGLFCMIFANDLTAVAALSQAIQCRVRFTDN